MCRSAISRKDRADALRCMHILLTRPKDDIPAMKHKLVEQGFTVSACPMLDINIMPVEEGDTSTAQKIATAQAYLFTSANGVRAASHHGLTKNPNLPVFAVGPATADACRIAGFKKVTEAGGDVQSLVGIIKATDIAEVSGSLVHISGRDHAGNLVQQLCDAGYEATSLVLYRAETISAFPDDISTLLASGEIDAVMFYSSRTATHFVTLTGRAGIKMSITAYCLSDAVAQILKRAGVEDIKVAANTTEDSMLNLLTENC